MITRNGQKLYTRTDFTTEHKAELLNRYQAGETQKELAEAIGTSNSLIGNVLQSIPGYVRRRGGNPGGMTDWTKSLLETITNLDAENLTTKEIAERMGYTERRVYQLRALAKTMKTQTESA